MSRIVISYPRSGLNWVRFCIEHQHGLRTPGKRLLIDKKQQSEAVFIRNHDPSATSEIRAGKVENAAAIRRPFMRWEYSRRENRKVTAQADDILVLLLRDYREVFVRSAARNFTHYAGYLSNIRYFTESPARKKSVFYYDDYVGSAEKMRDVIEFLEIPAASGRDVSLSDFESSWEEMGTQSRALYSKNQRWGGGSKTRNSPLDFNFHKKSLGDEDMLSLKEKTLAALTAEQAGILARYVD